jgi:hypothetical protein
MNNKKSSDFYKSDKYDIQLTNFIWLFYFVQILNTSLKIIFPINDILWNLISNTFLGFLLLVLLLRVHIIIKRNLYSFIFIELVFFILFIFSFILGFANISILLEFALWTLGISIPLSLFLYSINDKSIFLDRSIKYSRLILVVSVFSLFMMNDSETYVISLSYFMLLPLLFILLAPKKFTNKIDIIFIFVTMISLLFFGARGPFNGIFYALILKVIRDYKLITSKKLIIILISIIFIIFYALNIDDINFYIIDRLNQFGIYSRTLRRFFYGGIFDTSGRDSLWSYYIDLIKMKPIIGWGIGGGWLSRGEGPHNGIIEIYLAHGLFLGTFLSVLFISMIIIPIFSSKFRSSTIYICYVAVNVPLLISSGDIWTKYNLFIFFAIFISVLLKKREGDTSFIKLDRNYEYN